MSDLFMVPVFLLGALLAVIPVVIHLFFHRRAPVVHFSTIRFLQMCVRKTARRKRIENLLLLLFRMLLFGLLAVALAKPFLKSSVAGGGGPTSTVIVLDNSYSMETTHQGVKRFDTAKEIALRVIRGMSEKDAVALVLAGGPEADENAKLTHRLNDVHGAISRAEIFYGQTNLIAKINRAFEAIRDADDLNREVVVITDLQANALEGELARLVRTEDDVPIVFYDCGQEAVRNLAVTELKLKRIGRIGEKTSTLVAEVYNPSDREVAKHRVTLYVDGKAARHHLVTVPPQARRSVDLPYPFGGTKTVTGWVQLDADSLEADNRRNFRIGARDKIKTLVLREERAELAYLDDAYYLVRALAPPAGDRAEPLSVIVPQTALHSALDGIDLATFRVVFLANLRGLDAPEADKLRRFVETGGMLVFMMGDRVDVAEYEFAFRRDGRGLFPAVLQPAAGDASRRESFWKMRPPEFDGGALEHLEDVPPALFERVRAYRLFPVSDYDAQKVTVLAEFTSDEATPTTVPFLASAGLGKGEVFFLSVPATTEWTNFPATKVFVPILHEMIYSFVGKSGRLESVVAGQPKIFDFSGIEDNVTVKVQLRPGAAPVVETSKPGDGVNRIDFKQGIHRPDIYHYFVEWQEKKEEDYFVVNPWAEESNLKRLNDEALREKFDGMLVVVARTARQFDDERRRLREGHPLSGYVFLLLIAVAGLELYTANRTRPAAAAEAQTGVST